MIALLLALSLQSAQDEAAATEAVATFDAVLAKSKDPSARTNAVSVLSKTHHDKVVNRLGNVLTHDEKPLRIAAAQALATFKEATPELRRTAAHVLASALSSGSNQKEPEVQVALLAAIGRLGDETSVNLLKSHFDDKDEQIAQAAISAAGALKVKAMFEPLLEELRDLEKKAKTPDSGGGTPRKMVKSAKGGGGGGEAAPDPEAQKRARAQNLLPAVLGALSTLTAQNFNTSDDWQKWWSKNRNSFDPK